jgi:hypothetical protein
MFIKNELIKKLKYFYYKTIKVLTGNKSKRAKSKSKSKSKSKKQKQKQKK